MLFSGGTVEETSKRDWDKEEGTARKNAVKIEAKYEIGEYSILILSAKDSDGLTTWLKANKYTIPKKAHEVLEPYVKNKLKFFVVKVNLEKYPKSGSTKLRPIQIEYTYDKFMLPIRLGMANAESVQDLTVYAFSRIGRIECSNYRTIEMPTDKNIPLRIKDKFPTFYKYAFETQYDLAGKAGILTEYAWDISSSKYMKCDPCSSDPPIAADLHQAGAFWLKYYWNSGDEIKDMTKIADDPILKLDRYRGDVYFTRLHVRYDRAHFPDDLMFFHTPNKNNYQSRFVVTHPAEGDLTCEKGKKYVEDLKIRQQSEEQMLALLISWKEKSKKPLEEDYKDLLPLKLDDFEPPTSFHLPFEVVQGALITVIALMLLHHFRGLYRRRKTKKLI